MEKFEILEYSDEHMVVKFNSFYEHTRYFFISGDNSYIYEKDKFGLHQVCRNLSREGKALTASAKDFVKIMKKNLKGKG